MTLYLKIEMIFKLIIENIRIFQNKNNNQLL